MNRGTRKGSRRDGSDRRPHRSPQGRELADETTTVTAALDASYDRLTRENAALLLIDHQIGPLWELEFAEPRRRVAELASAARQFGVPTVITGIAPETWGPIIPELTAAHPTASIIVRTAVNAWEESRVRRAVVSAGRTKLIVAGSATEVGVVLCALSAAAGGYDVYVPIDASGQPSHRALVRLSRAGVVITTTSLVSSELMHDDADEISAQRRRNALTSHGGLALLPSRRA